MSGKLNVLFVCLGNICRSPTAQAVFEMKVRQAFLSEFVSVDSCGTAAYHINEPPDKRAVQAANKRNYVMAHLRGRQLSESDFLEFHYILAMDKANLENILLLKPKHCLAEIALFLGFDNSNPEAEVPDPYYGASDGFERVLDLIESASDAFMIHIKKEHNL